MNPVGLHVKGLSFKGRDKTLCPQQPAYSEKDGWIPSSDSGIQPYNPEQPTDAVGRPAPSKGGYPFMPVSVTPWMKYFWAKKKMRMTGVIMRSEPAISMLVVTPPSTLKAKRPSASG